MSVHWEKEKSQVFDRNQTHDLPNTGSVYLAKRTHGTHSHLTVLTSYWTGVLHTAKISTVEVMGSIAVGDSDFFFVPRSCHVDQFTFITKHKIHHFYSVIKIALFTV